VTDLSKRIRFLLPIAAAAVAAFAFQGTRGLYETTESRYAESSREMLETHQWLVPQLDYQPHWTKPPLTYWTIAGGLALLGTNAWGARLPAAVAFVVTVWLVMQLGALFWGRPTGWLAGLIYATAPFAVGAANTLNTDTLLALWMLLVVFAYWKARRRVSDGRSATAWVALLWLFAGLGFLTKGPPSLLALLVVAACHLVDRRRGCPVPRLLSPWGIPAFLLVGLGWYVWAAATRPGLLGYWLGDEVVGRIGTDEFGRNTQWYKPFMIYLPPLALGLGLWAVVAAAPLCRQAAALWRAGLRAALSDRPVLRFHLVWILVPLVILSVTRNRLPLYVLPLLPAVALTAARSLAAACSSQRMRRGLAAVGIASMVLVVGGKAAIATIPSAKDERALYRTVRRHAPGQTQVVNCTNRELYGLQFYLRGRLERIDLRGTADHIAGAIRALAARVAGRAPGRRYVIVTRKKDHRIPEALRALGVDYQSVAAPQGTVTVVGGHPGATETRAAEHTAGKG